MTEFKNYADYEEKCPFEAAQVTGFFDGLGLLLRRGLVGIDLISGLFLMELPWQKLTLYVEGIRERANEPRAYTNFEYLHNEVKKREQSFNKKVLRVVDIQTVSIVMASASVVAGVIYYAFQIRNQTRIRETDLIVRLSPWFNVSPDRLQEAGNIVATLEYRDYDDFVERYGSLWSGKPEPNAVMLGCNYMDGIACF